MNFQLIANRGQKGGEERRRKGRGGERSGVYIDAGYEKCIAEAIHQYSFPPFRCIVTAFNLGRKITGL